MLDGEYYDDMGSSTVGMLPPPVAMSAERFANARVCPPGMEFLISTSLIIVRQTIELLEAFTGIDTNNRYEVLDAGGRRLYLAAEQTNCCVRMCYGSRRPFTILILNNHGGICLKVRRTCGCCFFMWAGCCCNKLEIYTGTDVYIGKVTQNFCDCFCPRFSVYDADGHKCMKIVGPCHMCLCCSVHFKVKDTNGNEVGEIHKKWGGFVKEAFTTADTFGVSFPMDLDPRIKTLLLGAVFLIDFMYFENRGKDNDRNNNHH